MTTTKNKRAWSDAPDHIILTPWLGGGELGLDIKCATAIRDDLTVAIEAAKKRPPETFEEWWESLPKGGETYHAPTKTVGGFEQASGMIQEFAEAVWKSIKGES